jgi:predicted dehydrogenase
MQDKIRVGIVGASPDRGWAVRAHVPALRTSPAFELVAVSTSRPESARRAAQAFGVQHSFADVQELVALDEIDLVVITVKVATHAELTHAAIKAGKHVYCEWPLALSSEEAIELEQAAQQVGVRTAIGLQARYSPAFAYARELIKTGYVGRVTSATLYSSRSKGATEAVPEWTAYTYDRVSAAGLVEVLGGHSLDLVQHLLGPIEEATARTSIQHPRHSIAETGEPIKVTAPDHLDLIGKVSDGATVSVHLHDGEIGAPRTRLEISGTAGSLTVESVPDENPWAEQLQITHLSVRGTDCELPIPDHFRSTPPGLTTEAANVARLYQRLAVDLETGSREVPDFTTGRRLHELLRTAD